MTNTTNHPTGWTDERIESLKRLHKGGLSASLIAKELGGGLSRNAVIGKIHRLGIQRTGVPSKPTTFAPYPERKAAAQQRRKQAVDGFTYGVAQRHKQQYRERPQPVSGPIDSPNAKVWTERLFGECAFPLDGHGDGADRWSCCNRAEASGYCAGHTSVMYVGGSVTMDAKNIRGNRYDPTITIVATNPRTKRPTFEEWAAA